MRAPPGRVRERGAWCARASARRPFAGTRCVCSLARVLAALRTSHAPLLLKSSLAGDCHSGGERLAVHDKRVRGVRGRLWLAGDATLLHTLRTLSSPHTHVCSVCIHGTDGARRTSGTSQSHPTHHPLTTPHVPLYARTYTAGTVKSQLRRRHRSESVPAPRVGAPAHQGSGEEGGGRVRAETRC